MITICGIGFAYGTGKKWCKLCHTWYPEDSGSYCPVRHKRFRLKPRAKKARMKLEVPRGNGKEENYIG